MRPSHYAPALAVLVAGIVPQLTTTAQRHDLTDAEREVLSHLSVRTIASGTETQEILICDLDMSPRNIQMGELHITTGIGNLLIHVDDSGNQLNGPRMPVQGDFNIVNGLFLGSYQEMHGDSNVLIGSGDGASIVGNRNIALNFATSGFPYSQSQVDGQLAVGSFLGSGSENGVGEWFSDVETKQVPQ